MAFIAFVVKRGWVALKSLVCLCVCVCVDEGSNQARQVSFFSFCSLPEGISVLSHKSRS